MNNTIDFNTAKTIDTMSKKIDHIDDTVSGFFSFMHMVISVGLNGMQKNMALTMLFARTTLKCRPGIWSFSKPQMWRHLMRLSKNIPHPF